MKYIQIELEITISLNSIKEFIWKNTYFLKNSTVYSCKREEYN